METSNAVLIELDGFLFKKDPDEFGAQKVYQKINPETKELLADMQTYMKLIGFCKLNTQYTDALNSRLRSEGIQFDRLILAEQTYDKIKTEAPKILKSRYAISSYIDEIEDSPWHTNPNIFRLKL
jgi:hypothetical protein